MPRRRQDPVLVLWRASVASVLLVVAGCGSRTGLDGPARDAGAPDAPADVTPRCGPANCDGCCDDAAVCQAGDAQAVCGVKGRACVGCDPRLEVCLPDPRYPDSQVCFSPCDFRGCNYHCCLPTGECVAGDNDDACGSTGQLCVNCAATGQVCDNSVPRGCR
jgi:hypothetical protein